MATHPAKMAGEITDLNSAAVHPPPLDVPAAFDGCSVLLTGATGFLGKVLMEKL
jgi:hypothetical protein